MNVTDRLIWRLEIVVDFQARLVVVQGTFLLLPFLMFAEDLVQHVGVIQALEMSETFLVSQNSQVQNSQVTQICFQEMPKSIMYICNNPTVVQREVC